MSALKDKSPTSRGSSPDNENEELIFYSKASKVDYKYDCQSNMEKLAPRSGLQFKIGPQFSHTYIIHNVLTSNGQFVTPLIDARIDRGFEKTDNEWIGYKRNYFTLVASFDFHHMPFKEFLSETFTVIDSDQTESAVKYFALRLVSKCSEDGSPINLVQHTAKRDRGPQFSPPTYPSVPGQLPHHDIVKEAANVRNNEKIAKLNKIFYFNRKTQADEVDDLSALVDYPEDKISKVARYERIQFASSINYRKPTCTNKHFKLYVELICITMEGKEVIVAVSETPPLIIRGRSPSNYKGQKSLKHMNNKPDLKNIHSPTLLDANIFHSNAKDLPPVFGMEPHIEYHENALTTSQLENMPLVDSNYGGAVPLQIDPIKPEPAKLQDDRTRDMNIAKKSKRIAKKTSKSSNGKRRNKKKSNYTTTETIRIEPIYEHDDVATIEMIEAHIKQAETDLLPFDLVKIDATGFPDLHNFSDFGSRNSNYTYQPAMINENEDASEDTEMSPINLFNSFEGNVLPEGLASLDLNLELTKFNTSMDEIAVKELALSEILETSSYSFSNNVSPSSENADFKGSLSQIMAHIDEEMEQQGRHQMRNENFIPKTENLPLLDELLENLSAAKPADDINSREWIDYDCPSFVALSNSTHSIKI